MVSLILSERSIFICVLSISIATNLILLASLIFEKKRKKQRDKRIKEAEMIAETLLNKQIGLLRKGEYETVSIELEIAKYIKDVLLTCIVTGELDELHKKRLHKLVISEYPDIFNIQASEK